MKNLLSINRVEDDKFIFDFGIADKLLRIFSVLWLGHIYLNYKDLINRPKELFEPIVWIQKLLISTVPNTFIFYSILVLSIILCVVTIFNKAILYRLLLFVLLLYLNTIKWNYNFFSHVGHLFILAHFFTIFIPPIKSIKHISSEEKINYANSIRYAFAGVLMTYTFAGIWKFAVLFYKLLFDPTSLNWMSKNAVEFNALLSARLWDEQISPIMIKIYEIPFLWQFLTLLIFAFQLIAVLGAFNKKIAIPILFALVLFHIYNMLFINTYFFTSLFTLIILFLPYHRILKRRFIFQFKH